jgi:Zn-dependent peptidase ImmA (M78 family)
MDEILLEKSALQFRSKYSMNSKEPLRLKSFLQKINVITVFKPLRDDFSGMALKAKEGEEITRFILINSSQSIGKQHFTICHELYHLFIQENFTTRICRTGLFDKKDKEEYNADIFASYFLIPTNGILEMIPDNELGGKYNVSIGTIVNLEQFFSCSRRALLYRLKKMDLISKSQYEEYAVNVRRSALENGYNIELYKSGNKGAVVGDYGIIARNLFDKGRISQSHYYSLLGDLGIDVNVLETETNGEE